MKGWGAGPADLAARPAGAISRQNEEDATSLEQGYQRLELIRGGVETEN
jgi:hypothetical protein